MNAVLSFWDEITLQTILHLFFRKVLRSFTNIESLSLRKTQVFPEENC